MIKFNILQLFLELFILEDVLERLNKHEVDLKVQWVVFVRGEVLVGVIGVVVAIVPLVFDFAPVIE